MSQQPKSLELADWADMADKRYCMPKLHWCADMLRTQRAELEALRKEVEQLREDAARLDWLDAQNTRKNSVYGTRYGWRLNENCNRIALEDHSWPPVDVRRAIDAARGAKG